MLFGLTSRRFASRVFFDLSVNGKAGEFFSFFEIYKNWKIIFFVAGRLTFKLHDDVTPKTAENFRQLCTGEPGFGYEERGWTFFAYNMESVKSMKSYILLYTYFKSFQFFKSYTKGLTQNANPW